jgi:hypothetical protein
LAKKGFYYKLQRAAQQQHTLEWFFALFFIQAEKLLNE